MDIIGRSPLFLRMDVSTTTIAITATACVRFVSFHLTSLNRSDNMNEQLNIFSVFRRDFRINNKIRLIELFAGLGSQAMALKRLGADFEHYKVVEFDKYAIKSYNAIHGTDFEPTDITQISGSDLEIVDTETFTYLLTYLLFSLSRFIGCR